VNSLPGGSGGPGLVVISSAPLTRGSVTGILLPTSHPFTKHLPDSVSSSLPISMGVPCG
jgi:hypothetical protein